MAASLVQRTRRYIEKHAMLARGDRVLLAVSGGADSVALALLFARHLKKHFALDLGIAHLNHGMRGASADRDQAFVKKLAAAMRLPLYTETRPVKKKPGHSMEETAREVRYGFLEEMASTHGYARIATAHHGNDQAETVLMRLFSGCGASGLAGIRPVNGRVIRPLLCASRRDLESFVRTNKSGFCHDESNDDETHTRNKIRHTILPYLETMLGSTLCGRISRTAENLYDDFSCPPAFFNLLLRLLGTPYAGAALAFTIADMSQLPSFALKGVLEAALRHCRGPALSSAHIESIRSCIARGKAQSVVHLPRGFALRRAYKTLILESPGPRKKEGGPIEIRKKPGTYTDPATGRSIVLSIAQRTSTLKFPAAEDATAMFDHALLPKTMVLRARKKGDRFFPLGAPGEKKLKDFLINRKVPAAARDTLPLLCSGNTVIWVPGHRISDQYRVRPGEGKIVVVNLVN